jgi:ankyrin repeat protein
LKYSASRLDIYQQSSYAMVKLLLDAGAEVNAQNDEKETPLHLGSKIIRYNLVKNIKNKKKTFFSAAKYGQAETLVLLLAYKADFSLKNSDGQIAFDKMQTKSPNH